MTKIPLVLQKIKQLSKFASDTFFPNDIKCIVCDYELKYDNKYGLCDKCVLPHNSNFCKICGSNINGIVDICQFCKREEFDFEFARSPLVYQDAVKDLIRGYKFGHKAYLAPFFAQFLIKCYIENNLQVDFVTFVPIHISKLKTRGYNQSQLV
ncbi:MAG: hypothetical protein FWF58_05390, partial [Firmicutes bacterium]|nr:hypothetical protein [Bacillota bacterium]